MQDILIERPYEFIPPHQGRWWPRMIVRFLTDRYMRDNYAVEQHEVRGAEKLRASIDAGHGIVLVSNHCRPCDPMAAGWLTRAVEHPFYCMASWHTFMSSAVERFLMRRCGAFSIYREGRDHSSLSFCVESVATADRPVIIFAEGSVTRHNDRMAPLLDGSGLIARMAAKKRAKMNPPGKVVMHPIAYRYHFRGDLNATLEPVLERIERTISWQPNDHLPLLERVRKLGDAMLSLKELEYFGSTQTGGTSDRIERLLARIIDPLEKEWTSDDPPIEGNYPRVQRLRSRILPEMVHEGVSPEERRRRWQQLADCYVAQYLGCYPRDYLGDNPSPERLIETVERLEEDLTDTATIHGPLDLVIEIGDALEVPAKRERGTDGDPVMARLSEQIQTMLDDTNGPETPA